MYVCMYVCMYESSSTCIKLEKQSPEGAPKTS
jgi:hypothetical protein